MKKNHSSKRKRRHFWVVLLKKFTYLGVLILLLGSVYTLKSQTPTCANSISCIKDLSGKYEPVDAGFFMGEKVNVPRFIADDRIKTITDVLGQETGDKHINIDLTTQQLFAYEGNHLVMSFPISSGKWSATPTGNFRIWIKLRYTRMEGGSKTFNTYYNLPNVPYTMYFYNDQIPKSRGYGLHGAYWHNNFGHPMSHGCINISPSNAEALYNWADPPTSGFTTKAQDSNPGTPITIYGVTPAT